MNLQQSTQPRLGQKGPLVGHVHPLFVDVRDKISRCIAVAAFHGLLGFALQKYLQIGLQLGHDGRQQVQILPHVPGRLEQAALSIVSRPVVPEHLEPLLVDGLVQFEFRHAIAELTETDFPECVVRMTRGHGPLDDHLSVFLPQMRSVERQKDVLAQQQVIDKELILGLDKLQNRGFVGGVRAAADLGFLWKNFLGGLLHGLSQVLVQTGSKLMRDQIHDGIVRVLQRQGRR